MQKITPFMWFDDNAEEAVIHYTSIFRNSTIKSITRCVEGGPGPVGSVLVISFELNGQEFSALNGGPKHPFTDALSFVVNCENQEEVDYYWTRLSAGGTEVQCGWLKDKYGLSWQIVPTVLLRLIADPDAQKAQRVMQAMMKMIKIDIKGIEDAAVGK